MLVRCFLFFVFIHSCNMIAASETIQIYRWTDISGITHLSQFPPEDKNNNFIVEIIQMSIPVLEPQKEQNKDERIASIHKYLEDRETARELKIKTADITKTNKNNCELARNNLALYQSGQRIRTRDNDGEIQILSEQERIKRIKRSDKNIQSYCGNSDL